MKPGDEAVLTPLARAIADDISAEGAITFADFMERALYSLDGGYYRPKEAGVWGRDGGDYVTTIDISPLLAKMLAAQIFEMWELLGSPKSFYIVEAGAGRGWLTDVIVNTIDDTYPELSKALSVRIVEYNTELHKEPTKDGRISWHKSLEELKAEAPLTGCIYTNELLDALAFHRVTGMGDGSLREIFVDFDEAEGRFKEVLREPSAGVSEHFKAAGIGEYLMEGSTAELSLKASEWIREAAELIGKGFLLTIDYGMATEELYFGRPRGTLLCHYRHTINELPYERVGVQDITAHVDFSSVKRVGAEAGLRVLGFTSQRNFLMAMGILEELKEVIDPTLENIEDIRYNQSIKELIMPGGIGDTMKVLVQYKKDGEVLAEESDSERLVLKGFSLRDMKEQL